jgi:hypothetical protein
MNDSNCPSRAAAWPPTLFSLGRLVATPSALRCLAELGLLPSDLLHRHQRGDHGDLCAEDLAANTLAVQTGARILSAYELGPERQRIWVLTEAQDDAGQRQSTCILLPSEY